MVTLASGRNGSADCFINCVGELIGDCMLSDFWPGTHGDKTMGYNGFCYPMNNPCLWSTAPLMNKVDLI